MVKAEQFCLKLLRTLSGYAFIKQLKLIKMIYSNDMGASHTYHTLLKGIDRLCFSNAVGMFFGYDRFCSGRRLVYSCVKELAASML